MMDFAYSPKMLDLQAKLRDFMEGLVLPNNERWHREVEAGIYPIDLIDDLKIEAKAQGLWNLFLPGLRDDEPGTRLTNLEYAPLAEIMGRVPWPAEVFNCNAPDTGNIEILHMFATPQQREQWLKPLLEGDIRLVVSITEPDVASSDPTNLRTSIVRDADHYVINGRNGSTRERCTRARVY
jgi:acyl-CoA dehydrogenase